MQTDIIGNRLKNNYENIPKTRLMRRCPVAIRIDGKSFHTFTRYFKKPFDDILRESMMATMKYLCENIQGCVFGYTQSDEITLILIDYQKLNTSAWFDYEVQKMCSISASMATMAFNKEFAHQVRKYKETHITGSAAWWDSYNDKYYQIIYAAMNKGAMFDARCFNIPKEEVTNLLYWRQIDAARNSIQMVGRTYFSDKELEGKKNNEIQDMLHEQKGINWNNYSVSEKRGTACIRTEDGWFIDRNMPQLKGEDRQYLDRFIFVGEEE